MSELSDEAHSFLRFTLALPARCRTFGGFSDEVVMRDISSGGCRIISSALSVRADVKVVIRPNAMEGLAGTVRWINGQEAGIEFDRPLYVPLVEHLHRTFYSFLAPEVPYTGKSTVRSLAA